MMDGCRSAKSINPPLSLCIDWQAGGSETRDEFGTLHLYDTIFVVFCAAEFSRKVERREMRLGKVRRGEAGCDGPGKYLAVNLTLARKQKLWLACDADGILAGGSADFRPRVRLFIAGCKVAQWSCPLP